jgi:hypothetical protein
MRQRGLAHAAWSVFARESWSPRWPQKKAAAWTRLLQLKLQLDAKAHDYWAAYVERPVYLYPYTVDALARVYRFIADNAGNADTLNDLYPGNKLDELIQVADPHPIAAAVIRVIKQNDNQRIFDGLSPWSQEWTDDEYYKQDVHTRVRQAWKSLVDRSYLTQHFPFSSDGVAILYAHVRSLVAGSAETAALAALSRWETELCPRPIDVIEE